MALKPCRECKTEVSTEAKTCPHCGVGTPTKQPPSAKESLAGLVVLVVIVVALVAMCSGPDKDTTAAAEPKMTDAECRQDLACHAEKGVVAAGIFCKERIERQARGSVNWTDGVIEPKMSRYRWRSKDKGTVTYIGDKVQFQNGFGAYVNMVYECDMDPLDDKRTVLDVRVSEGRL